MNILSSVSKEFITELRYVYQFYGTKNEYPISDIDITKLDQALERMRDISLKKYCSLKEEIKKSDPYNPIFVKTSLFRTMDIGRLERAHTNTLAWLLNPESEHELGTSITEALVAEVYQKFNHGTDDIVGFSCSSEKLLGEGCIIDIWAKGKTTGTNSASFILAIEAKIDANESDGQLEKYDNAISELVNDEVVLKIFLTPNGRDPISTTKDGQWTSLSYTRLATILWDSIKNHSDKDGFHFARYYIAGILQDILQLESSHQNGDNPYTGILYLSNMTGENR